jgi:hypothetical protein
MSSGHIAGLDIPMTALIADQSRIDIDKRRFRANVFVDLPSSADFAEDGYVGQRCASARKRPSRSSNATPGAE